MATSEDILPAINSEDYHLCYFSYDELLDLVKYPILFKAKRTDPAESSEESEVIDMPDDKRITSRRHRITGRLWRLRKTAKSHITNLGILFQCTSEVFYRDLKRAFSFSDESGKEVNFLHDLEYRISLQPPPESLDNVLNTFRDLSERYFQAQTQIKELQAASANLGSVEKAIEETKLAANKLLAGNAEKIMNFVQQNASVLGLASLVNFKKAFTDMLRSLAKKMV